jgi:hypothetical protein
MALMISGGVEREQVDQAEHALRLRKVGKKKADKLKLKEEKRQYREVLPVHL